jgi:hypothetical protein
MRGGPTGRSGVRYLGGSVRGSSVLKPRAAGSCTHLAEAASPPRLVNCVVRAGRRKSVSRTTLPSPCEGGPASPAARGAGAKAACATAERCGCGRAAAPVASPSVLTNGPPAPAHWAVPSRRSASAPRAGAAARAPREPVRTRQPLAGGLHPSAPRRPRRPTPRRAGNRKEPRRAGKSRAEPQAHPDARRTFHEPRGPPETDVERACQDRAI